MWIALSRILTLNFVYVSLRMATPVALAAIGEVYAERSGVMNVGIEGTMLVGAFSGILGAHLTGSPWIGLLSSMVAGGLVSSIHALVSIGLRANQVVSGIAINIGAVGLTSFLSRMIFGVRDTPITVPFIDEFTVPLASQIPLLGPVFFQHTPLVYLAFILAPISSFILSRTSWGLAIRAVGEHPRAADAVGISVPRIRYLCVILGGIMAGIAGACLSLAQVGMFVDQMVAGRGFIALAAVVFGRWNAVGAFLGALLFGVADTVQLRIQAFGVPIPHHLVMTLPYVLTLLAVATFKGRAAAPAALTKPYSREEAT